ncbi:MAG TPA: hypothetical protein VMD52_03530 [Patescibacteria group bacterium]|nr:hypothetical protein [Patescibacteria group bacterium]
MYRLAYLFLAACIAVTAGNGCSKKEGEEPTKYKSQAGLEKLTQQAAAGQSRASGNASDNRAFNSAKDTQAQAAEVRDLDSAIRPVLKRLFGDARIVSESARPETKRDGEVVENRFTYVVRKYLAPQDGESLHAALRAAHFSTSPRLGSKPTIWSGGAGMSLFKSTSLRSYSLVINVDTRKQQIVVESYRLGSKYDRLM